jgi:hypothetical protein
MQQQQQQQQHVAAPAPARQLTLGDALAMQPYINAAPTTDTSAVFNPM